MSDDLNENDPGEVSRRSFLSRALRETGVLALIGTAGALTGRYVGGVTHDRMLATRTDADEDVANQQLIDGNLTNEEKKELSQWRQISLARRRARDNAKEIGTFAGSAAGFMGSAVRLLADGLRGGGEDEDDGDDPNLTSPPDPGSKKDLPDKEPPAAPSDPSPKSRIAQYLNSGFGRN